MESTGVRKGKCGARFMPTNARQIHPCRSRTRWPLHQRGINHHRLTYRVFESEERRVGDGITMWRHGIQHNGGPIGEGATEAPGISVDGHSWEEGISSETARQLAHPRALWGLRDSTPSCVRQAGADPLRTVGVAARRPGAWGTCHRRRFWRRGSNSVDDIHRIFAPTARPRKRFPWPLDQVIY